MTRRSILGRTDGARRELSALEEERLEAAKRAWEEHEDRLQEERDDFLYDYEPTDDKEDE